METVPLIPHPEAPPKDVSAITVDLAWANGALTLSYHVSHDSSLKITARHGRRDELWKTTCFEIFVRDGDGPNYVEFNLAPEDAWAGYGFTGERQGMHNLDVAAPTITTTELPGKFELIATFAPGSFPADLGAASLSAVIEELDGTKSYWAIAHPRPEEFDFHHPRIFVLDLARPDEGDENSLPK